MRASWGKLRALGIQDVIAIDAEYISRRGWHVTPVCFCAKSLWTKRVWRRFCFGKPVGPCPFPPDPRILFLSYNAPAEWSFYLVVGWPLPATVIDLFAEMCLRENGRKDQHGSKFRPSLLYTMRRYGFDAISVAEKHTMRAILRLGEEPCSGPEEEAAILAYCTTDVLALEKLFPAMLPEMNISQAILRGAHTWACAASEFNGIPIQVPICCDLKAKLPQVRTGLAMATEAVHKFGAYRLDKKGSVHWNVDAFDALVAGLGPCSWPRTTGGKSQKKVHFRTDRDTFKRMAQRFPQLEPLREVRNLLEELGSFDLAIGPDGRVRCDARPWASVTGRNYPRGGFLFAVSKVFRHLMRSARGFALAYVDLRACEFGIQAARSRDTEMIAAYRSGEDVYLRLALLAGAVPEGATKHSHSHERALYKTAMLAAGYGQKPEGFAVNVGCSVEKARMVHEDLRRVYRTFFDWREEQVALAVARGEMVSFLGWRVPVYPWTSKRFLYNYPIQSAGADILRTAGALMYAGGLKVCALVQDAVLIEDTSQNIEKSAAFAQECWRRASASVLEDGFELDSDVEIFRWPHSFDPDKDVEDKSKTTWALLRKLLREIRITRRERRSGFESHRKETNGEARQTEEHRGVEELLRNRKIHLALRGAVLTEGVAR
jgi:hypothetical protein